MTYPPYDKDAEAPARHLVVNFAGLQRMRMRKLQIELVNRVVSMHFKEEEPSDWESLLKEYSKWDFCLLPPCVIFAIFGLICLLKRALEKVWLGTCT